MGQGGTKKNSERFPENAAGKVFFSGRSFFAEEALFKKTNFVGVSFPDFLSEKGYAGETGDASGSHNNEVG